MNYCPDCGRAVSIRVPDGDNLPRHVCDHCSAIHYQNPKIVAGCIPEWQDKILICKRAIDPQYGKWTLPAGFMENGETVQEAAARETMEEAMASVHDLELFGVFNIKRVNQVYIMFRGQLPEPRFGPGAESLECELLTEDEIPWLELAFTVVSKTLELYFQDRRDGLYRTHMGDITPRRLPKP